MRLIPVLLSVVGLSLSMGAQAAPSRNYKSVKAYLDKLVTTYPKNVKSVRIGVAGNGEAIMGVAIGSGALKNIVVGTHHGNEYGSTEVAKSFAASLAANPIPGQTVYVVPVLNIPGFDARDRYENGHDPNRDYPGPCGSEGPFKLKSTAALAAFIDQENIISSATLHTFYPAVVYPWGLASRDLTTPYEDFFKDFVALATRESGYQTGNATEVIYAANGTYEDYAYWKHGVWSLLFELGHSHSPSQGAIDDMVRLNVPGLRRMMENSPKARATDHVFTGKCDSRLLANDRHDE